MADEKRIKKPRLKEFLVKKYKVGLGSKLVPILQPYFGGFQLAIDMNVYCDNLETLFNQDEVALKKFAFKIFDVNGDGKVSENDLFELMKMCQGNKGGLLGENPINDSKD